MSNPFRRISLTLVASPLFASLLLYGLASVAFRGTEQFLGQSMVALNLPVAYLVLCTIGIPVLYVGTKHAWQRAKLLVVLFGLLTAGEWGFSAIASSPAPWSQQVDGLMLVPVFWGVALTLFSLGVGPVLRSESTQGEASQETPSK